MSLATVSLRTNTASLCRRTQPSKLSKPENFDGVIYGDFSSHLICRCTGVYYCSLSRLAHFQCCRQATFIPISDVLRLLERRPGDIDRPVCLQSSLGPHCECMAHCKTQGVTTKVLGLPRNRTNKSLHWKIAFESLGNQ